MRFDEIEIEKAKQMGLTKSQLGFYFMPRHLKFFKPDCYIDYGNGYQLQFYSVKEIKKTIQKYSIPLRPLDRLLGRRIDDYVYDYLNEKAQ